MPNLKKILKWSVIIYSIVFVLFWITELSLYKGWITKTELYNNIIKQGQSMIIIGAVAIIIIWILFLRKGSEEKEVKKEYVNGDTALGIVLKNLIIHTGIPHLVDYSEDKNGVVKPVRKRDISFQNVLGYSQRDSGVPYLKTEWNLSRSSMNGLNLNWVRLDEGEEKISKNTFSRFLNHTSHETYFDDKNTPPSTITDENKRLAFELMEGEYTEKQFRQMEEFLKSQQQAQPQQAPILTEEEQDLRTEAQRFKNIEAIQKVTKK